MGGVGVALAGRAHCVKIFRSSAIWVRGGKISGTPSKHHGQQLHAHCPRAGCWVLLGFAASWVSGFFRFTSSIPCSPACLPLPVYPAKPLVSVRTSLRTASLRTSATPAGCLVTTLVTACLGNYGLCCYSGCYSTQKMRCFVFTALFTRGREGATLLPVAGAVVRTALLFRAGAVTAPAW